ncbi:hypothetical protein HGG79_05905 [Clostridium tetanomorphum]|uniref:SPOR domain-containing protein n=1 Tax=Clostridium tetanomorphum TaxID=1553 RepID=A0A923EBF0_CLOTT|nr:hypothetical protein [Clostridium tetanomorphum]
MKYTRYDLRRRKNNFYFFLIVLIILLASLLLGSLFSKIFMKNLSKNIPSDSKEVVYEEKNPSKDRIANKSESNNNAKTNDLKGTVYSKGKTVSYVAIQGGVFENEKYASETLGKLKQVGNPFTIKEGKLKRVFLGIYEEKESLNIIKILDSKKIANSKMILSIKCNDLCDVEIVEIINAYIKILNKLSEKNVKSIQTKEIKSWCASLKEVDKNSKNIKVLNELKNKINKLPDNISKDKTSENYIFIYNFLKKLN